jgi:hypothetical protein
MEEQYPTCLPEQEEENGRLPTTDELIAQARANRQGEEYPTPERLLENLPVVLRGLCDYVLTGEATAYDVARALGSIIDVIEHSKDESSRTH